MIHYQDFDIDDSIYTAGKGHSDKNSFKPQLRFYIIMIKNIDHPKSYILGTDTRSNAIS